MYQVDTDFVLNVTLFLISDWNETNNLSMTRLIYSNEKSDPFDN